MTIEPCEACAGTGTVTVAGPRLVGAPDGQADHDMEMTCPVCEGTGEVPAEGPQPLAVPVTWGGHTVDAPGFDQDQFERAMARAFTDDLRLKPLRGRAFLVYRPGASVGQRVTRTTCSCPAGEHEVPCKHRAVVIAHLDVRVPEMARRWARRMKRREAERQAAPASTSAAA